MTDTRSEFILQSREQLVAFERSMLAIEQSGESQPRAHLIEESLRAIHSLKGDSGFLGFIAIRNLAHLIESMLELYRSGVRRPSASEIEALLAARDRLAVMLEDLDHCQNIPTRDVVDRLEQLIKTPSASGRDVLTDEYRIVEVLVDELISRHGSLIVGLRNLEADPKVLELKFAGLDQQLPLDSSDWPGAVSLAIQATMSTKNTELPSTTQVSIDLTAWQAETGNASLVPLFQALDNGCHPLHPGLHFAECSLAITLPSAPIVWRAELASGESLPRIASPVSATANQATELSSPNTSSPATPQSVEIPAVRNVPVSNSQPATPIATPMPPAVVASDTERLRSLRINVELLDRLMNLTGELTLIRNQTQVAFAHLEGESRNIIQRLNSVTTELQDAVSQTRMQPVGNLFGRFPRMVRDLARQLGKDVEVVTVGQEVELDKTVLERLSDPLTHLIRNSIDHGIEPPQVREAAGKPRCGKIILSATPADGQVFIEIRDDGKGIDLAAVRSKALAMQLRSENELDRMSSRELCSLILLPGFSTAKAVTDVSGRGVGMDVVKTNLEELEGSLTIDSSLGHGTSMQLRVPLTLAIVPCLIVTVGAERFAVPQRELEEVVCLHPGCKWTLEHAFDTEVFRLRDKLLPVVRFSEVLERPQAFTAQDKAQILAAHLPQDRDPGAIEYILVLRCDQRRFGLLVEDVQGREEIVVKPMHPALRRLSVFAGATLMGDGRAALIANVEGILEHTRCLAVAAESESKTAYRNPDEVHRVLLFEYGANEQFALPLVQVRRVELLDMSSIERVGQNELVTIDGQATRILRLDQLMSVSPCSDKLQMFLILPKFVSEPMGILASRIVDTESLSIDLQTSHDLGVLGTAIVRNRHSLFLDVQQLREALFGLSPKSKSQAQPATAPPGRRYQVLLVDDTPFFREVVKRYLADDETDIQTAVDGRDGLRLLATQDFDLVVSDIEMPTMDGWQFCQTAREQGYSMPFVALTSLSKDEYERRSKECGFDDFEEKLDHDRLKRKIVRWLHKSVARQVSI